MGIFILFPVAYTVCMLYLFLVLILKDFQSRAFLVLLLANVFAIGMHVGKYAYG